MPALLSLPLVQTHDPFADRLAADGQVLERAELTTLQINVGKMCNLACHHCHVEAGPRRKEIMTWDTMQQILDWLDLHGGGEGGREGGHAIRTVDLTGGAPEMNPMFRDFVRALRARGLHVLDRCNLTILLEPGYEDMPAFLAEHGVEIVASLPCYIGDNVDKQRGKGVFGGSIEALHRLNSQGYGHAKSGGGEEGGSGLKLDLVYKPHRLRPPAGAGVARGGLQTSPARRVRRGVRSAVDHHQHAHQTLRARAAAGWQAGRVHGQADGCPPRGECGGGDVQVAGERRLARHGVRLRLQSGCCR